MISTDIMASLDGSSLIRVMVLLDKARMEEIVQGTFSATARVLGVGRI